MPQRPPFSTISPEEQAATSREVAQSAGEDAPRAESFSMTAAPLAGLLAPTDQSGHSGRRSRGELSAF